MHLGNNFRKVNKCNILMFSGAVQSNLGTQLHNNVNLNALCEYRTVKMFELQRATQGATLT